MIKKTGVFATKKEAKNIRDAFSMPVISMDGMHSIGGNPQEELHEVALSHGLPEIKGFYGIDADNEFIKMVKEVKK